MALAKLSGLDDDGPGGANRVGMVEDEIDQLYRLPAAGFVQARNELSRQLKARGEADLSKRVKALARPTPAAWAVNQLHWFDGALLDELREASSQVREAQGTGDGEAFTRAVERRRQALASAQQKAIDRLSAGAKAPSASVLRAVAATLEAVTAPGAVVDPPVGRLVREMEVLGFDALGDGFSVAPRQAPTTPQKSKRAAPETGERQAEAARLLDTARGRVTDLETRRVAEEAAAKGDAELAGAARRLADEAEQRARATERQARRSQETVQATERAIVEARARVAEAEQLVALLEADS